MGFTTPPGTSDADARTLTHAIETAVAGGARLALVFAAVVVVAGAVLSVLIPKVASVETTTGIADSFEVFEPLDVDPALID